MEWTQKHIFLFLPVYSPAQQSNKNKTLYFGRDSLKCQLPIARRSCWHVSKYNSGHVGRRELRTNNSALCCVQDEPITMPNTTHNSVTSQVEPPTNVGMKFYTSYWTVWLDIIPMITWYTLKPTSLRKESYLNNRRYLNMVHSALIAWLDIFM